MTFDQAMQLLQDSFGPQDESLCADGAIEICSAGPMPADGLDPVLCATRELAIKLWWDAMKLHLRAVTAKRWRIVDGPHMDKFQITLLNDRRQHRIADERFSVTAKVATRAA